ncbi:hypothetical protein [Liberiplasma polymorphum]|uniref:hypothetical protein n=1 Tax=Liberiplasma polymorphum TaxID=3374570 RepID=UPI003774C6B0
MISNEKLKRVRINSTLGLVFHPASPIVILFVGFLLQIIFNDLDNLLINFNFHTIVIFIIIIWFSASFIIFDQKKFKLVISNLENNISKYQHSINELSLVFSSDFEKIANNFNYARLLSYLRNLISTDSRINSLQVYKKVEYQINGIYIIKLIHFCGYANELYDTNAIYQIYYRVPVDLYNDMTDIMDEINNNSPINLDIDKITKKLGFYIKKMRKFYNEYCKNGSLDALDYCSFIFRYINVVSVGLFKVVNELVFESFSDSEIQTIIKFKRTGVLGTILLKNPYFYKNQNSLYENKKRSYLSLQINDNVSDYTMNVTLSTHFTNKYCNNTNSLQENLHEITTNINNELAKSVQNNNIHN